MGRRAKYSEEIKLEIVREYMEGNTSSTALSKKYGCGKRLVHNWLARYKSQGVEAFREKDKNQFYTSEFKRLVVEEYLRGGIGLEPLAIKYNIRSNVQIRNWVKLYNGHKELKSYGMGGGIYVTKGRKTTYEERIEIVEDCLKNGQDYNATAAKYKASYQQVYSWVNKYNAKGVVALKDKRGRGKDLEDMNQVERLETENKLLKAKLEHMEIEIELKKKMQEVQMRLASTTRKKK